ncbi:hypothetical protein [Prevotella sp.]|uniref:hypothetical protein n=1 Tax=Prevotella sp. TaxID=59823 RepID=UPI0025E2B4F8|nr:hypothetical protein [Prevotella sp.]
MDNTRKFFILAAFAFLFTVTCKAQDVSLSAKDMPARFDESALQRIMPTRYGGRSRQWREEAMAEAERQSQHQDSLMLPPLNAQGQVDTTCRYPLAFGGWNSWGLHRGLNVQIGASVFAEFGKGAHSGAGFQQNIALMYAMPINDKLSVAVGGYLNNVNYAGGNWHDAGLSAVVGYRFNEHLEAYIWGQKSINNNVGNRLRYGLYDGYYGGYGFGGYGFGGFSRNFYGFPSYSAYDLSGIGDRIGATLRYNFNNNMSIEVTVENRWMPSR